MKTAVIDLGTNTFNLLIRDLDKDQLVYNGKIGVKLGEGGLDQEKITPQAFARGLRALEEHKKTIKALGAHESYAFATSAIRSASNGSDFVKTAKEESGININVIDGHQEAELIYLGVKQAVDLGRSTSLIIDIGGGSTEFIIANQERIFWKNSYKLGSSRLLEIFKPNDPLKETDIQAIVDYISSSTPDLLNSIKQFKPQTLIGSSGSFDTLASMLHETHSDDIYDRSKSSYVFDVDRYRDIAQKMLSCSLQQRLETPGMIAMRADMMPMACIQINFLLNHLSDIEMKLSAYALKEGVFATLKHKNKWLRS